MRADQSLSALRELFAAAPEPTLDDVVGEHLADFAGPAWLRRSGAPTMAVIGMKGWCGKRFAATGEGVNLVRSGAGLADSVPITARLGAATRDGRAAVVVTYPASARWPLRRCRDELRRVAPDTLLGLSFGVPLAPPGGAPFLLRRT